MRLLDTDFTSTQGPAAGAVANDPGRGAKTAGPSRAAVDQILRVLFIAWLIVTAVLWRIL